MEINHKIIVVTGAGSGIGKALAKRFKAEGTQHIVVVDINADNVAAVATQLDCIAMTADVSKEEDIRRVIEDTEANVGPIDLFCSNAGVGLGPSIDSPNQEWQSSWDINVMPHVYAGLILTEHLINQTWEQRPY